MPQITLRSVHILNDGRTVLCRMIFKQVFRPMLSSTRTPSATHPQIALQSVCVIDDGQTALVEGLRVAPQERGKGVARVLLRFCSQMVKCRYPSVKVSRLTRDDPLGPRDLQKYQLIAKQVRMVTFLPVCLLANKPLTSPPQKCLFLTSGYLL